MYNSIIAWAVYITTIRNQGLINNNETNLDLKV